MGDLKRAEKLIAEARNMRPLTPEWHRKCEEIERAFGWKPLSSAHPISNDLLS